MGAMVSTVLNIQDLAKGISNKTYKTSQPSKMNYGDPNKYGLFLYRIEEKDLQRCSL